jgi:Asp-tRNA(Asn)/Glu-tRNA(Gln) amidotransferase A subunit family amidase
VAAGMVPLAVGTQTGGSMIRPAAYCGIVGIKPTFGAIPRTGVLTQSPFLDTLGVFARSVTDAALLTEVLMGHDPADRATQPAPAARMLSVASAKAPVAPMFAHVDLPAIDQAEDQTRLAMRELVSMLGGQCFETALPDTFDRAEPMRRLINFAEMAKCYDPLERRGRDRMSDVLKAAMDEGKAALARDYIAALDWREVLNAGLDDIFDRCDAILTPATTGPAPAGLESTGTAIFNGLWTLCGTPAVTVPLFTAENGLPMGVQLVGRRGDDARLLRTARWLTEHVAEAGR